MDNKRRPSLHIVDNLPAVIPPRVNRSEQTRHMLQAAKDLLAKVDKGLTHDFTTVEPRLTISEDDSFLSLIQQWMETALSVGGSGEKVRGLRLLPSWAQRETLAEERVRRTTIPLSHDFALAVVTYDLPHGGKGIAFAAHQMHAGEVEAPIEQVVFEKGRKEGEWTRSFHPPFSVHYEEVPHRKGASNIYQLRVIVTNDMLTPTPEDDSDGPRIA